MYPVLLVPASSRPGPHGAQPQKKHKKEAILSNNDDLWRFFRLPETISLGGHFSKLIFAEDPSTRSPWCLEKSKEPSGGPRIIWSWKDFPRMSKIMNLKDSTIRWDRMLEARGLFRCRICFRSILSRQNALNRHMEQKEIVGRKSCFSVFRLIGPL